MFTMCSELFFVTTLLLIVDYSVWSEFRGELFIQLPGCSEGFMLPVTPVESDVVASQGQCLANCLGDSNCMSVNLCDDPQSGQVCHRLPETSNGTCSDLQAAAGCVYLEPVNVCQHGGTFNEFLSRCDCYDDFTGVYCERRYRGEGSYRHIQTKDDGYCTEAHEGGMRAMMTNKKRVIRIRPLNAPREYEVECLLGYGGYTTVEKRPSTCNDYNKTWAEYRTGWSTSCGRWLGLEALHYISHQGNCTLDIYMKGLNGFVGQFYYKGIRIDDEASGYKLSFNHGVKHRTIAVGNGFEYGAASKGIKGQKFATWDRPDPSGCAVSDGAGWWYGTDCPDTNLHKRFDTEPATNMAQWPDDNDTLQQVKFTKIQIIVNGPRVVPSL